MTADLNNRGISLAATLSGSAGLIVLVVAWMVFSYGYVEDDAFIHLEFARSVAEGNGFSFDGLITNSDTAPLWVILLALIHALGISWIGSAKIACLLGVIVAVLGTWRLAYDLAADGRERRYLAPAAVMVTVLNPFFVHWSFSGMESVAALGVSVWAIWAIFLGEPSRGRLLCGAVLVALGPLLRPELLLLDVLAGPALLWRYWQLAGRDSRAHRLVTIAVLGICMALPLAIWSAYALRTFGAVIPNTNLAKRGGAIRELAPRLLSVYLVGFPVTLALLPCVAALRPRRGAIPPTIWVLMLWPLACIGFYLADHTIVQTRYCLLSMPSLSIAVLWLAGNPSRSALSRAAAVMMAIVSVVTIGLMVIPHVENKKECRNAYSRISTYLKNQTSPQAPVAVYAIGQIAFESRHPVVDIGGITQPSVIPYMADREATVRWAKAQGARYFISRDPPERDATGVFSTTVPFLGWTFHRSLYGASEPLVVYPLR